MNIPRRYPIVLAVFVLLLPGCGSPEIDNDTEVRVEQHLAAARALESSGNLRGAVQEYQVIAEMYPGSTRYPLAVRRIGLLNLDPRLPSASDSAAIVWLKKYSSLPVPDAQREESLIISSLLDRYAALENLRAGTRLTADSLSVAIRHQNGLLSIQQQRLQELDTELKQVRKELARLKEVDVRLSKMRRRP
jgi:hypothetical protein